MINVNNKKSKIVGLALAGCLVLGGVFLSGLALGRQDRAEKGSGLIAYSEKAKQATAASSSNLNFNLYWEVWDRLKNSYVDKNKLSDQDLFYGSLRGLAEATDDAYTVFLDPEEAEEFAADMAGTFEGVGAEVGMRNDIVTIIAPIEGAPAARAGLRAGDKIYAIDGQSTIGLSVDEAVKLIRGPKGTKVVLTIIRGEDKPSDITITRDTIFVKSLSYNLRSDNFMVIKVSSFNDDTLGLFEEAINTALLKNPKGIILDLRNNPGGYLDTAVAMAGEWVEAGPVVAEQYGENKRDEYPSSGRARLKDFPTVVLINGGSASASEILAGALRDYHKATLVGEQTFGKGSVQSLMGLSDGSSLKVTVAKWLTPAGDFIDEKGLEPQVKVEMTLDDLNNSRDPQLDKAVEILKKK